MARSCPTVRQKQTLVLIASYLMFSSLCSMTSSAGTSGPTTGRWWRLNASGTLPARRLLCSGHGEQSVTCLAVPNCARYEKWLHVTHCSAQLITGWKRWGTSYSQDDTNAWMFNSFGQIGPLVESGLPVRSQVWTNTWQTQLICHPGSHTELTYTFWQTFIFRRQHLYSQFWSPLTGPGAITKVICFTSYLLLKQTKEMSLGPRFPFSPILPHSRAQPFTLFTMISF